MIWSRGWRGGSALGPPKLPMGTLGWGQAPCPRSGISLQGRCWPWAPVWSSDPDPITRPAGALTPLWTAPSPSVPFFGLDQVVLGVLPTAVSPLAALCPFQRTRGWLHSSRGWDGGVSACIVSPLLSHTEVPTLCVLLPLGGLNIDSGGRGQPSCSCYHPPAPECHRWHQVQPQHQGRLAKPRRVAKDPKGRVLAQPRTHPALHPTSSHRARAGGPQLPPAPPGAETKGQKPFFGGVWQYLAALLSRCCSGSLLAAPLEQDGAEQRGGSVRPPGSPAHWC